MKKQKICIIGDGLSGLITAQILGKLDCVWSEKPMGILYLLCKNFIELILASFLSAG